MPFRSETLSVLAYANGLTLWGYQTPDASAAVVAAGYFNAAAAMVRPGDVLLANLGVGTAAPMMGFLAVTAAGAGSVSVTGFTRIGP
jgi:hypothetical protein